MRLRLNGLRGHDSETGGLRAARIAGFSLIELVLVLTIIAVAAAVGIGSFAGSLGHQSLEAAAGRLVSDLELARGRAIALREPVTVRFVPDTSRYQLVGVGDLDHAGQDYEVDLAAAPYAVAVGQTRLPGGDGELTFDAYGLPVVSGTFPGVRTPCITVSAGGRELYVVVDEDTGRPSVQATNPVLLQMGQ